MIGRLGGQEIMLILFIALMIFGPKKLPEMGRAIGKGLSEFKNAAKEIKDSVDVDSIDSDSNTQNK